MTEDYRTRAKTEGTPLIDGNTVTFVCTGHEAPTLIADFNGWEYGGGTKMEPAGEDLWMIQVELPEDGYIEYAYLSGEERLLDPFNPRRVSNGVGKYNHYFYMPGAGPSGYTRPKRGVPRGKVFSDIIEGHDFVVGGKRRVHFYHPPVEEATPLLVVWDGQDYLRRAYLPRIVDNLIAANRIQPLSLAMIEHGRQARMVEYGCSEVTLGFLGEFVLPAAQNRLNLLNPDDYPGAFGILGASMGGLMALYTGLRLPGVFGKVLSQSGAFSFGTQDMVVWDLIHAGAGSDLQIWMDVGRLEWLLDCNQRMADLLEDRGYAFTFHAYSGGHNYTSWRNQLVNGLIDLFGSEGSDRDAR